LNTKQLVIFNNGGLYYDTAEVSAIRKEIEEEEEEEEEK